MIESLFSKDCSSRISIRTLSSDNSLKVFFDKLSLPRWFEDRFAPEFEKLFKLAGKCNKIFLATPSSEPNNILGCVYCNFNPHHRFRSSVVPIFGWMRAENEDIFHFLLNHVKRFAASRGFSKIRGPINPPKLFGGWGAIVEGTNFLPTLNTPPDDRKLSHFLINNQGELGETTTYYNNTLIQTEPINLEGVRVRFVNPTPAELFKEKTLSQKLIRLITSGFSSFLPDTSVVKNQFVKFSKIYAKIEHPEDFYQIAMDTETKEVVGCLISCPNLCDVWAGKELKSCLFDSIVVDKRWRRTSLSKKLWFDVANRLRDRGIKDQINNYLWEDNEIVLRFQAPYSEFRHEIRVYHCPTLPSA